ncbi:MAG: hypothetical protein J5555_06765 [Firmicutes bacterium]|nr:hypothetical protein [Bacillota bacterium]
MKHIRAAICILVIIALLSACSGAKFSMTTTGQKSTVKVNEAEDGDFIETEYTSVGKNRIAVIEADLDKGQLQIDFVEVTVFAHVDQPADVIEGDIAVSVTVGSDDKEQIDLPQGDYVIRITAVGTTTGEAKIEIEKKE